MQRTQIVVERLTKNIRENSLSDIFGHYGEIEDIELPINRQCTFSFLEPIERAPKKQETFPTVFSRNPLRILTWCSSRPQSRLGLYCVLQGGRCP